MGGERGVAAVDDAEAAAAELFAEVVVVLEGIAHDMIFVCWVSFEEVGDSGGVFIERERVGREREGGIFGSEGSFCKLHLPDSCRCIGGRTRRWWSCQFFFVLAWPFFVPTKISSLLHLFFIIINLFILDCLIIYIIYIETSHHILLGWHETRPKCNKSVVKWFISRSKVSNLDFGTDLMLHFYNIIFIYFNSIFYLNFSFFVLWFNIIVIKLC